MEKGDFWRRQHEGKGGKKIRGVKRVCISLKYHYICVKIS
jgi:hypothetical protein